MFKFSNKVINNYIEDGYYYKGEIVDISPVENDKSEYMVVTIRCKNKNYNIWVNDQVDPQHPMYKVFENVIYDEEMAENFNPKFLNGTRVIFKVKKINLKDKKGNSFEKLFFEDMFVDDGSDDWFFRQDSGYSESDFFDTYNDYE